MKTFRLSIRPYIYLLIIITVTIVVNWGNNGLWAKLFALAFDTFAIVGFIDSIKTKIIVEEKRLIYKQSFRTRTVFWKDIKAITYQKGMKDFQITIWLLTAEDMAVFKPLRTIGIKYLIKDYKELVKLIVEKCKNNPRIIIEQQVLDMIK